MIGRITSFIGIDHTIVPHAGEIMGILLGTIVAKDDSMVLTEYSIPVLELLRRCHCMDYMKS